MRARVRVLGRSDLEQAMTLLNANPIENLFVLARVATHGLERLHLGCEVYGLEGDGQLRALVHAGSNVVPVNVDQDNVALFAQRIGPLRQASSIMGNAAQVRMLWEELSRRGSSWSRVREVRARQPLMAISGDPLVEGDPRVRVVTMDDFRAYFTAAVAMYTEEVGVSPMESSGSYRRYMQELVSQGRAFGIIENGKVLFKADIGAVFGPLCQIQGVWLAPELRGQRVSVPAMAQVVRLAQPRYPVQSLYVNDFNTRARRLYHTVGFETVGEFATVLY
ncbi:GNAT family N-acetyltransferase [Propionibacteriaceae bacterium Y1923]|uniref:GNAT family N-acetyltransferase n=1 Tax=Aestuariimicrobium sp. Y1814 TaxID=3418742 RepID=UPI003C26E5B9